MRTSSLFVLLLSPIAAFAAASPDSRCGGKLGYTCTGTKWGTCCSKYGWCGHTSDYCDTDKGCQAGFGTCTAAKPSSTRTPTPTRSPTPRTTCGVQGNGKPGVGENILYNRPLGGCKATCGNYATNGQTCRVYAVITGTGCAIYVGSPPPTFEQLVSPATGTGYTFYDISCM
ncbi:hypothetical protein CC86DRAFT_371029 [Ophiobolus disseminans]|uniref:Chitin-binding type-1 domain-containing protein n=1 Tax=Ophiobolus disseminans TaxID=1469910 RepID=A0A6A6ZYB9_9PLEO|nr:hypothetical protein CC86DRAFT_371029 [Ophiobolus disseminans]